MYNIVSLSSTEWNLVIDGDPGDVYIKSQTTWTFDWNSSLRLSISYGAIKHLIQLVDLLVDGISYSGQVEYGKALVDFFTPAIVPPTPSLGSSIPAILHIEIFKNELRYFFFPGDMDFLTKNPEIFLMRENKKQGVRRHGHNYHGCHWVHTADQNCDTKWIDYKQWFRGHFEVGRNTEWEIPTDIVAYRRINLSTLSNPFNKCIYRNGVAIDDVPDYTFTVADYRDASGVSLTGKNKRKSKEGWFFPQVVQMCLALAIDNPLATVDNGLCPKIFIQFSEPFYSFPKFTGNSGDFSGYGNISIKKGVFKSKYRFGFR